MVQAVSEKISEMDAPTSALSAEIYLPATVGTGSSATSYKLTKEQLLGGVHDIRAYGCTTTATAAAAALNTAAIERILVAILAAGGGTIYVPPGTFLFSEGSLLATVCIQLGATVANVTIQGAGEGISILKLKDSGASHVINIDGASNIKIRDLTIDGNRANNTTTSWHAMRTGSSGCDGLVVENVTVQNTRGYGFGWQGGNKKRMRMLFCTALDTGLDGCDFKNTADGNEDIVVVGYQVKRWGLATDGVTITEQAGLDARGPIQVNGVWASEGPADGNYIRFREGETADASLGSQRSHLTNFVCVGNSGATSFGVYVPAHDVQVSNGYIKDMFIGTLVYGERVGINGVVCESCDDESFQVNELADSCRLTDCHSLTATGSGFRIKGPRCAMTACSSDGDVAGGIVTEPTATGFTSTGFDCQGTAGTMVGVALASADATIVGGDISGCFRGLSTVAARSKFVAVNSHANTGQGAILGVGGDDAQVIGCSLVGNGTDGVEIRGDRARILNNTITGNTGNGVDIIAGGDDTFLDGNVVSGNGAAIGDAATGTAYGLMNSGLGTATIGAHSALAAETVSGYITVRDSAGVARKLAVVS